MLGNHWIAEEDSVSTRAWRETVCNFHAESLAHPSSAAGFVLQNTQLQASAISQKRILWETSRKDRSWRSELYLFLATSLSLFTSISLVFSSSSLLYSSLLFSTALLVSLSPPFLGSVFEQVSLFLELSQHQSHKWRFPKMLPLNHSFETQLKWRFPEILLPLNHPNFKGCSI